MSHGDQILESSMREHFERRQELFSHSFIYSFLKKSYRTAVKTRNKLDSLAFEIQMCVFCFLLEQSEAEKPRRELAQ